MPIDYKKYPPNWKKEIRPAILKRAGDKCENCGLANYAVGYRAPSGEFQVTEGWGAVEAATQPKNELITKKEEKAA